MKKICLSIVIIQIFLALAIGLSGEAIACSGVHCHGTTGATTTESNERRTICNRPVIPRIMYFDREYPISWSCRRGGLITAAFLFYTDMYGYRHRVRIENLIADDQGNIKGVFTLWGLGYHSRMTQVRVKVIFEGGASKTMTANNFIGNVYQDY